MRAVTLSELLQLALVVEEDDTAPLALWFDQCHAADKYRKRYGRAHPNWGAGRIADRLPHRVELGRLDIGRARFRRALAEVLRALDDRDS
jgi:hypothetical protein